MYFDVTMTGGEAIDKALKGLEPKIAKKLVRQSLKKALEPIKALAIINAATIVGGVMGSLLQQYMEVRPFRRQRKGQYGAMVRIKNTGMWPFVHITKAGVREYIPAAIEYGHAAPYQGAGHLDAATEIGKIDRQIEPRAVPARPFMRPAFEGGREQAEKILGEEIRSELKI